jgi:signal peptidase II
MIPRQSAIVFFLGLFVVLLDRTLKALALHGVQVGFMADLFRFELYPNPVIAFSLGAPILAIMVAVPIAIMIFLFFGIRALRERAPGVAVPAFLVVIASISNYLDRVLHGYVVDYVSAGRWFPVFNLSDVVIVFSIIMLVLQWKDKKSVEHV